MSRADQYSRAVHFPSEAACLAGNNPYGKAIQ